MERRYVNMLRDSELKKAGDVNFVPDEPEYENVGEVAVFE